ncbi:MAG: hypothetical protein IKB38_02840 [Clostridia bacterium]|nr:hypothetical protein [Clostridia bacterium]
MKQKNSKLINHLLFPPIGILLIFIPSSFTFLIYALIFIGTKSPLSYTSYVLAFYSLLLISLRVPGIIRSFKFLKSNNKHVKRFIEDSRFRINVSLYCALILNTAYALFQLGLGFRHMSAWYYSTSVYYILLALIRFFILRHTRAHEPKAQLRAELVRYGLTGGFMLVMNLTLTAIILLLLFRKTSFAHHEITTITMAAYTFAALSVSIIGYVKYRRHGSPLFSASSILSLNAALVSMLTLEASMLDTFGTASGAAFRLTMLTLSGGAVFVFNTAIAIFMIIKAFKELKKLKNAQND